MSVLAEGGGGEEVRRDGDGSYKQRLTSTHKHRLQSNALQYELFTFYNKFDETYQFFPRKNCFLCSSYGNGTESEPETEP